MPPGDNNMKGKMKSTQTKSLPTQGLTKSKKLLDNILIHCPASSVSRVINSRENILLLLLIVELCY